MYKVTIYTALLSVNGIYKAILEKTGKIYMKISIVHCSFLRILLDIVIRSAWNFPTKIVEFSFRIITEY